MHILVINDDGPPSPTASPYVHSFVLALQAADHLVSVCLPNTQRSWISKAHMIAENVSVSYYRPPDSPWTSDEGTTSALPIVTESATSSDAASTQDHDWILLSSTPATCAQIGIHHLFGARGPVDLVVSGPNLGRNTTAVFGLSSGTLGGAIEAALCDRRAIALSYAFQKGEELDRQAIEETNGVAVRIVAALWKRWSDAQMASSDAPELYSVNVPMKRGISQADIVWTRMLSNKWEDRTCFEEVDAREEPQEGPDMVEHAIRHAEPVPAGAVQGHSSQQAHRSFKWAPGFADVHQSVVRAGPGSDGWAVNMKTISITPLKANFMHAESPAEPLKLSDAIVGGNECTQARPTAREETGTDTPTDLVHAYVDYADSYVQPMIVQALREQFPSKSLHLLDSPLKSEDITARYVHIGQYEELPFEHILMHPTTSMINAYIIRKALIRKHYLSNTVESWIAKHPNSILATNVKPSCSFELDYAEFLDDALVEAFELRAGMDKNSESPPNQREWWILKPGMSDRGQGIQLFSTEAELQEIFERWEEDMPDSDEEYDADEGPAGHDEHSTRGIVTSHLRHFIAQPYIDKPLLLQGDPRKFHVRTYVVAIGAMDVYVYRHMLALFAAAPYAPPSEARSKSVVDMDMSPHLTNTCAQETTNDASSTKLPAVKLLAELDFPKPDMLDSIRSQINALTGEIFEAAARSQSIHFQPLPNAFEVFGLDFLVDTEGKAWLLECNAFPDFEQTGAELSGVVQGLWNEVMKLVKTWFFPDQRVSKALGSEELMLVRSIDLGRR